MTLTKRFERLRVWALLPLILLSLGVQTFSQTTSGSIWGRISDASPAVVPGAAVTLLNSDTGLSRSIQSDPLGNYFFPLIDPGRYEITVRHPGYKPFHQVGVDLGVNQQARIDVLLEVGGADSTITVLANAEMLSRDDVTLGALIDKQKISDLPLNGRDFFQLVLLGPGVVSGAEGSQNSTQGGAVSANGMREQSNNFLLDGVDNNDPQINQVTVPPPLDGVQEFRIETGNYRAEFGTRAGAQLNFLTRSGTNLFRFSAFEFHRNASLDAKNFFDLPDTSIPKFIRNQFGASLGGPIVPNRTFFFINYEGLRQRKAITRLATVPTPELLAGDFSGIGFPILNPFTGEPFPENRIPPNLLNPVGTAIAAFFPLPNTNQPGGNHLSQPVSRDTVNQFLARFDHEFGDRDSFFARYAIFDQDRFDAFDPSIDPTNLAGFGSFARNRGQNLSLGWIHIFGDRLLNDLRFGANRLRAAVFQENVGNDILGNLGIQGFSRESLDTGFPATEVVGFDPLEEAINLPRDRADNTFQLVDGLSWQTGKHLFKFGGDVRWFQSNLIAPLFERGLFVFTGAASFHPVADLLLGLPTVVVSTVGDTHQNDRSYSLSLYFQDDYKLVPSLSLNYGLRYEFNKPATELGGRFTVPDLTSAVPRFVQCGQEGIPRGCVEGDQNNLAPRLGLAWAPWSGRKIVVRAGYGIFIDNGILFANQLARFNPPNFGFNFFFFPPLENPLEGGGLPQNLVTLLSREFPNGYAQHWSLNLQQNFWRDYLIEIGYVGTKGTKLQSQRNINQPRPGPDPFLFCRPGICPFPAYGPIGFMEPGASSIYHALQLRGVKRLSQGFSALASYTYSKSIDDSSQLFFSSATLNGVPQDSENRSAERGLSDFDVKHRLVLNTVWELPSPDFSSRAARAVFADWQVSGILAFQSGRPFTPLLIGTSNSNTDNGLAGSGTDRPNLIGNPRPAERDPAQWVLRSAFQVPSGTFGNAGRNILQGPGFHSVDFTLAKVWQLSDRGRLQFRTDFFNLFNTPNFDLPIGDLNNANFGRVTSARDSRQIQFGLRLDF